MTVATITYWYDVGVLNDMDLIELVERGVLPVYEYEQITGRDYME